MTTSRFVLLAGALALSAGCADGPTGMTGTTALLSVAPAAGAVGIAVDTTVTITFSHPMGVELYAALHERNGVAGPVLAGTWHWSAERTFLTFEPTAPLMAHTAYTLHLGGGMTDSDGHLIDLVGHQPHHGGTWVTQHMMDQRTMGGMHGGMMHDMTGTGWQHENGTYGMIFTFTTE